MGGIRKYKRSVAKFYARHNGLIPNKIYRNKTQKEKHKSGVKILFERLFGKN